MVEASPEPGKEDDGLFSRVRDATPAEGRDVARAAARILNGVRDGCVKFTNRAFDMYMRAVYHQVPIKDDKGNVIRYERDRAASSGGRAASDVRSETEKAPMGEEPDGSNR
jgi:hypothetical protein